MGTEPAWPAMPLKVQVSQSGPAIPETIPMGRPALSRTGPCSICNSKKQAMLPRGINRFGEPGGIAAECPQGRFAGDTLLIGPLKLTFFEAAEDTAGAKKSFVESPAFFVGEGDHVDGPVGGKALFGERLYRFDGAKHAGGAVEPAAIGLRVEVGAHHQNGQIGLPAFQPADEVAEGDRYAFSCRRPSSSLRPARMPLFPITKGWGGRRRSRRYGRCGSFLQNVAVILRR